MKSFLVLLAAAATASAHYTFPALVAGGTTTGQWQYVRKTTNYQSNGPVTDVTSTQIRCYELAPGTGAQTYEVAAGSTIGFTAQSSVSHPGTLQFYLAKVPSGKTAADWDGSGQVWFKIFEQGPNIAASGLTWPSQGLSKVTVPLPKSLPSGEYLFRVEHIALHSAGSAGGAQFYISCAQIKVTGGGNGSPGPLVSFPGAYSANDPGIKLNIYYPVPTSYTPPGPKVWSG
ncbi:lytic polysaccharide monooxygenase [Lentithecium fluviatile CBS 122367]|uniref:lytic cellulose monooxygenase (C4-dehydrogenating) n=1 Tax=Lentithecium fluviatile CBS 122367 TaxID=1168545 RepID=A0A6G1II62_9PLEO|nr:lytic polysaccharide monooxygenase [Lentithecium fluviatile CBS 122367]KAF2681387.1 lytic polysaccharide monooxygenase [Lentithecium fluviatile CBS 122367]